MDLYDEFLGIIDALTERELIYAICGGIGEAFCDDSCFTKEIELIVRSDDLSRIVPALVSRGFSLSVSDSVRRETLEACVLRTAVKLEADERLPLILIASRSLDDLVSDRQRFLWRGRIVPVASRSGLAALRTARLENSKISKGLCRPVLATKPVRRSVDVDMSSEALDRRIRDLSQLFKLGTALDEAICIENAAN